MYELYGASVAGKMLTALGRLFIKYIQFRGFTCRIDDLLLTVAYKALARADANVGALTRPLLPATVGAAFGAGTRRRAAQGHAARRRRDRPGGRCRVCQPAR